MRLAQMRVGSVALLLILTLSTSFVQQAVCADDHEGLNSGENAYVSKVEPALKTAIVVALNMLDIAQGDGVDSIFIREEKGTGDLIADLDTADRALDEVAAVLLETPPSSMTTLQGPYAETAEMLEVGYSGCRKIVVEEGEKAALEWGKDALASIYGVGGEGASDGVATAARVKSCMSFRSEMMLESLANAQDLLGSKIKEIQENRESDVAVVTPGGGLIECFIATAAYGSPSAAQIDVLRDFRDEVLAKSEAGRDYIGFYYAVSPPIATFIAEQEWLRTFVRELVIDPIVYATDATRPLWSCS